MKRIYSYVFAAVAMFAAVSCQKENAFDAPEVNEEAFAITAVANADTKTVLDGLKTYWTPTDALTAFDATGANRKFTTDITENSASARFTTPTFTLPENIEEGMLLAVYPYTEGATTDFKTKVYGLEIPATQQAVAGGFDPDAAISYVLDGVANQYSLKFNNVYGLFEFTVKNDGVKKVTVKANGDEKIAGPVDLYLLNGTLAPTTGAVSEVTLEGDFVNGSTYYVALIPGTYASGVTVSFDGTEVKSTTKSITLEKNQVRGMGELRKMSDYAIIGSHNNWNFSNLTPLYIEGEYFVAYNMTGLSEFKIVNKTATDWNDGSVTTNRGCGNQVKSSGITHMSLYDNGSNIMVNSTSVKYNLKIKKDLSQITIEESEMSGIASIYSIVGSNDNWDSDIVLVTTSVEDILVAKNVYFKKDCGVKIRQDRAWTNSWSCDWKALKINEAMDCRKGYDCNMLFADNSSYWDKYYDIYVQLESDAPKKFKIVTSGSDAPSF